MKKITSIDLFAGVGGFSLGLEETGCFETVAFVENNEFCQKVLKQNWSNVEVYPNVIGFKYRENVGLVTAGFPCQDISLAGDGAGITGERSGLFWYIIKTLCMVGRPKVLLENVAALLNRGLCTVLGALASFGYDSEWHCIPASYVGAWHRRDRIWIFADPDGFNSQEGCKEPILRQSDLSIEFTRSVEEWSGRSNLPPSRFYRDGDELPNRMDRIKCVGNSVYSRIPEMFGRAIVRSMTLKGEVNV